MYLKPILNVALFGYFSFSFFNEISEKIWGKAKNGCDMINLLLSNVVIVLVSMLMALNAHFTKFRENLSL